MIKGQEQTKYYVSLGWWILRLSIIILILIPGSLPLMFGFVLTHIYKLFDPELTLYNRIIGWYGLTIGTWLLIWQLILIVFIIGVVFLPYILFLRYRYPGKNMVEITKTEVKHHVEKLGKPENPKNRNLKR